MSKNIAKILSGKLLSEKLCEAFKEKVRGLKTMGVHPKLIIIKVGNDPASESYITRKIKYCELTEILCEVIALDANISTAELLEVINKYNNDTTVHGLLVQFPLPDHINIYAVKQAICVEKDVDCFNPDNLGKFFMGIPYTEPCTPSGVREILVDNNIDVSGKKALVIGRSLIVGKPMVEILTQMNATVTCAHSKTNKEYLSSLIKNSDIIVSAIGIPNFITPDMLGTNQVLIDVGINRVDGKLQGDFSKDSYELSDAYTPVPGGVGPMTVAMLAKNTIICAENIRINNPLP